MLSQKISVGGKLYSRQVAECPLLLHPFQVKRACRLVEKCLEETVARYLAAVLTYIKIIDETLLEKMQRDKDTLISSFQDHIRPDRVIAPPTLILYRATLAYAKL